MSRKGHGAMGPFFFLFFVKEQRQKKKKKKAIAFYKVFGGVGFDFLFVFSCFFFITNPPILLFFCFRQHSIVYIVTTKTPIFF
jgi:hypothetical protein